MKQKNWFDPILITGAMLIILGLVIVFASAVKSDEVSFVATAGFPCNEQAGTDPCQTTYIYRNVPKDEAVAILGQVIKWQGGEFELLNIE